MDYFEQLQNINSDSEKDINNESRNRNLEIPLAPVDSILNLQFWNTGYSDAINNFEANIEESAGWNTWRGLTAEEFNKDFKSKAAELLERSPNEHYEAPDFGVNDIWD